MFTTPALLMAMRRLHNLYFNYVIHLIGQQCIIVGKSMTSTMQTHRMQYVNTINYEAHYIDISHMATIKKNYEHNINYN